MSETAIVVTVLEAERIVGRWRRKLTENGANGMPAHVTLISPFSDTAEMTAERIDEARTVVAEFDAFDCRFSGIAHFETKPRLLYLQPQPDHVFRALIEALSKRFPEHPPYGGVHPDVIPHLTAAESDDHDRLRAVERELEALLPIEARLTEAVLMELQEVGWRRHSAVPLNA